MGQNHTGKRPRPIGQEQLAEDFRMCPALMIKLPCAGFEVNPLIERNNVIVRTLGRVFGICLQSENVGYKEQQQDCRPNTPPTH